MSTIDAFLEALTLEPVGEDHYRATSLPSPHGVVFGGQLLAQSIMAFCRERVAPYKRIRRIEFAELPKTISGKIRRVELRARESDPRGTRGSTEFWEEDFSS